jgi:plastocyanin
MRPLGFIILSVAVFVLPASPAHTMPPQLKITIESAAPYFLPAEVRVGSGVKIQWDNPTPTYHTITHDECVTGGPCLFDSGSIAPDSMYMLPGLPAGWYPYHCRLHPIMRGVLEVVESVEQPSLN